MIGGTLRINQLILIDLLNFIFLMQHKIETRQPERFILFLLLSIFKNKKLPDSLSKMNLLFQYFIKFFHHGWAAGLY